MNERRLAADEQLAEDRQQAKLEAHSPAKRGRRAGSAGHRVAGERAHKRRARRQSRRASGGGHAPLPAGRRAHLHDLVGRASPCRLRLRWGASNLLDPASAHYRTRTDARTAVVAVRLAGSRLTARPQPRLTRPPDKTWKIAAGRFRIPPLPWGTREPRRSRFSLLGTRERLRNGLELCE